MPLLAKRLPPVILLLLAYMVSRLHRLAALPLFIDESFHIETAQRVRDGQILASATHGRLGRVWLNALLGPDAPAAIWTTRAGTVLVGLVGVAAFYALGRACVSHRAGLIAAMLWITAPYMLFYERMALADPMLGAASAAAVWVAWRLAQSGSRRWAAALGLALVGVLLAKASGVVWLPLPIVAALLLRTPVSWRERAILPALAYAVFGALWVPFTLVLRWKSYDYFGLASVFVEGADDTLLDRVWRNISDTWQFDMTYLGLPVIVLAVLGGLWWLRERPRSALLALLALGMGAGGAAVFGVNVNSRYALNHVAWVLLPLAAGIGLVIQRWPRWERPIYAALVIWIAIFFAPFQWNAWHDPADLSLAGHDPYEYISGESSGYGVTEIGQWLSTESEPLPVIGLVANCQTLRLAAYPRAVECPPIRWEGTNQDELMALVEAQAASGPVYVAGEELVYLSLSGLPLPYTNITTAQRPDRGVMVGLYRIEQGAQRPAAP